MRRWIFIYSSTERAVFRVNHGLLTHAPSSSVRLMYKCILHWRPQLPSATYPHWQRLVKATTTQTNTKLLVLIISQILLFNCTIRFSSAILSFRDISPLSQIHYIFNDSVNGRIGLEDSHMTADGVWKFRAATLNTHKETDRQRYTYTLSVTLRFNVGNWKNGEQAQELWGWSLNNWGGREDGRNKAHLAKRQLRGSARSPWPGCREDVWRRVRTQRRWRSSLFLISSFLKSFCVHTCPPKRWRDSFFCIPMQQMIKWLKFKTSKL